MVKPRLSATQLLALENLAQGRASSYGLRNSSQHGGHSGTMASLHSRGFVADHEITEAGREALREHKASPKPAKPSRSIAWELCIESTAIRCRRLPTGACLVEMRERGKWRGVANGPRALELLRIVAYWSAVEKAFE